MRIWNVSGWINADPTGKGRPVMAAGRVYTFAPFTEKEIYNTDDAIHIASSYKGLVLVDYNEGAEKEYGSLEAYKRAQEIKGLRALLEWQRTCLADESNGEEAAKATKGAANDLRTFDTGKFEKRVKLIEKWLIEAGEAKNVVARDAASVVEKRPDWTRKEHKAEVIVEPRTV